MKYYMNNGYISWNKSSLFRKKCRNSKLNLNNLNNDVQIEKKWDFGNPFTSILMSHYFFFNSYFSDITLFEMLLKNIHTV